LQDDGVAMETQIPWLLPALPELMLAAGAMLLLMAGVFRSGKASRGIDWTAILLLVATGAVVVWLPPGRLVTFGGSFVVDDFARFLKLLALTGSASAILMSFDYLARGKQQRFEYSILILLSTTGMMMLISAADLIALYLGLELMSLALYVVAAIDRESTASTEAGLKYFVLGALSSGMLLYGSPVLQRRRKSRVSGWCSAWSSCSPASASKFQPCRFTCGRPTSMRARRRRLPPSSPPLQRLPVSRCLCAPPLWRSRAYWRSGSRSWSSSPSLPWRLGHSPPLASTISSG
jgi:hypothetical protein